MSPLPNKTETLRLWSQGVYSYNDGYICRCWQCSGGNKATDCKFSVHAVREILQNVRMHIETCDEGTAKRRRIPDQATSSGGK